MNTNLLTLLKCIDKSHRVKLCVWSADFDNTPHWPCCWDLDIKESKIKDGIFEIHFDETDDDTGYNLWMITEYFESWYNDEDVNEIKFFFRGVEIIPSIGDVGHSDKITHINFEPKK